jgi:hypothetical protein
MQYRMVSALLSNGFKFDPVLECAPDGGRIVGCERHEAPQRALRLLANDPKRWLSAKNLRTIPRYPRAIDFGTSNRQNECHLKRARLCPCSLPNRWVWNMSTDPTFATGKFSQAIRFVLVNNRVPRTDHCALCGGLIEEGYVRDSQTRLTYCDIQCFAAWTYGAAPVVKNRGRRAS